MKTIINRIHHFWFEEVPAERLAILRILSGLYAFWFLSRNVLYLHYIAQTDPVMFAPKAIIRLLPGPLHPDLFLGIVLFTLVLNVLFIIGWKYKITGIGFAFFLWWVLSYRNSWSMLYHIHHLMILFVGVVGIARSADALSMDAIWRARKGKEKLPGKHWQYGWPIKLILSVTLIAYFLAGVAKLAGPLGWGWMFTLREHVAIDTLRKVVLGSDKASTFFPKIYTQSWFFIVGGIGSFFLELLAPLVILNKKAGKGWAVLTFAMHWTIYILMGIRFPFQLSGIPFLTFFEPERWLSRLTAKRRQK